MRPSPSPIRPARIVALCAALAVVAPSLRGQDTASLGGQDSPTLRGQDSAGLRGRDSPSLRGQDTAGLRPSDLYRLSRVEEPAISPDGSALAFTVVRPVEGEDRLHREVWIQELAEGRPEGGPVRFSDPGEDSRGPRWSPDGSVLSFVSKRSDDPNPVWFLRVRGPGGEAFHVPGVRGRPLWSPEGDRIAFLAPPEGGGPRHLHVVSAAGGASRRLTRIDGPVTDPVWAPDGEGLYFTAPEAEGDDAGEGVRSVWYVPLESGGAWRVTRDAGSQWAPAISSDGDRLAYLHRAGPRSQAEIRVAGIRTPGFLESESTVVTGSLDQEAGPPTWGAEDRSLLFLARDGPRRALYRVGVGGGSMTLVLSGDREVDEVAFAPRRSHVAFAASTPTRPAELYVAESDGTDEERITRLHDDLLERRELVEPERITWTVEGVRVEGWITAPRAPASGSDHALVVLLPDGPHGVHGRGFDPAVQVLSSAGFWVFHANLRGSEGYGERFRARNRGEWGRVEGDDLEAGLERLLEARPEISPERIGVTGEGYGGFLSAWLTATTDRFRAAVPVRMVADWESWYGTSSSRRDAELGLGAPPWRARGVYRRLSPFSYVQNVSAPTLLIHDEGNPRMPAGQSEIWFTALRRLGVETEWLRLASSARLEGGALGPRSRVRTLERTVEWFRRWLGPDAEGRRADRPRPPG